MNYTKANQALAKEFGAGQVEVRKAGRGAQWEYTLWFKSDNPKPAVIKKAKQIVDGYQPTLWLDDMMFHSDN
jgi:hypothetical protein